MYAIANCEESNKFCSSRQDCASFLADYEKYTEMGYTPVHGDESWVPANHTVPKTWQVTWLKTDLHTFKPHLIAERKI